jgi:ElaB/YqjD/DUF883 family membrane-anchored ribosome-binding protein
LENNMENTAPVSTSPNSGLSHPTDGLLNKAVSNAHAAVNSIVGAAEDAANKAKPAIDQSAAIAHNAVDKAADAAGPAVDWLAEQGESLKVAQKKLLADTSAYISANPLKAIGIAVATGFLLNRILR